jgi:hypothetical protein
MSVVGRAPSPDGTRAHADRPARIPSIPTRRWRYSLPGLAGALVFVCLSLTPSLLPRTGVIQGLVCGITGTIGYGVGVVAAWVWRAFADRDPQPPRRRSWQIFAVVAVLALIVATAFGRYWQGRIRTLMNVPPDGLASLVVTPLVAAIVFVTLIALSRGLRRVYRWSADCSGGGLEHAPRGQSAGHRWRWELRCSSAESCWTGSLRRPTRPSRCRTGPRRTGSCSRLGRSARAAPSRWCRGSRWGGRAGTSPVP